MLNRGVFCVHRNGREWRHPSDMGALPRSSRISPTPSKNRKVAAATRNQALNAIVFLYKQVLGVDPGQFNAVRAKRPKRLPAVLSRREAHAVVECIRPPVQLMWSGPPAGSAGSSFGTGDTRWVRAYRIGPHMSLM